MEDGLRFCIKGEKEDELLISQLSIEKMGGDGAKLRYKSACGKQIAVMLFTTSDNYAVAHQLEKLAFAIKRLGKEEKVTITNGMAEAKADQFSTEQLEQMSKSMTLTNTNKIAAEKPLIESDPLAFLRAFGG